MPRNVPRSPGKGTPKQTRLRRKAPVENALVEGTSSRRLVEYFVVISSQPRWQGNDKSSARNLSPSSPKAMKKNVSPPKKKKKDLPKQSARWFGRRASGSSFESEKREQREPTPEPLPESPRQSSAREEQQQEETGNIRMPQTAGSEFTFQPKITARYPPTEYPDHALNPMLIQFCFPHSDVIVPSRTYVMPRIHHFVLTNDKGRKVYGTCLDSL